MPLQRTFFQVENPNRIGILTMKGAGQQIYLRKLGDVLFWLRL